MVNMDLPAKQAGSATAVRAERHRTDAVLRARAQEKGFLNRERLMLYFVIVYWVLTGARIGVQYFWQSGLTQTTDDVILNTIVVAAVGVPLTVLILLRLIPLLVRAMIMCPAALGIEFFMSWRDSNYLLTAALVALMAIFAGSLVSLRVLSALAVEGNAAVLVYAVLRRGEVFGPTDGTVIVPIFTFVMMNAVIFIAYMFVAAVRSMVSGMEHEATEAEQENTETGDFLALVSHEIRTPLNAILGSAELIIRSREDMNISELQNLALPMRTAGGSLLELINNILDIAKMERGRMRPMEVAYAPKSLLREIERDMTAERAVLTIEASFKKGLRLVGDDARVKRILTTLLKYMLSYDVKTELSVFFGTNMRGERNMLQAEIVIEKEYAALRNTALIKDIDYQKFFLDRSEGYEEMDLGLVVVTKMVNLLGGHIGLEPTAAGYARCRVEIPQAVGVSMTEAEEQVETEEQCVEYANIHILVVDDNPTNLIIAKGILEGRGSHVETVLSGREALNRLEERAYDIVFMDHRMPGMDGLETTQALRKLPVPWCATVPVIALTADADCSVEAYTAAGMQGYLGKPIDPVALDKVFKKCLDSKKLVQAAPAVPPPAPGSDEADVDLSGLGQIANLDVAEGVRMCRGKRNYTDVLRRFHATGNDQVDRMQKFFHAGDIVKLRVEAHSVKSAARSIGMMRIGALAERVERACEAVDRAELARVTGGLLSDMRLFLEALTMYFQHADRAGQRLTEALPAAALAARLDEIAVFVRAYEMDKVQDMLAELCRMPYDGEIGDRLRKLLAKAEQFAYSEIEDLLAKLRAVLGAQEENA
ncbi:MAG: response regulator [Clostridiales bacterium]|nr:response regulator [Clostridiales bacterium]